MNTTTLRNLSSVPFFLKTPGGVLTFHQIDGEPVRQVARNEQTRSTVIHGVPVYSNQTHDLLNLPAAEDGIVYVIDEVCAQHPNLRGREDVFTTADFVGAKSDETGEFGCIYSALRSVA